MSEFSWEIEGYFADNFYEPFINDVQYLVGKVDLDFGEISIETGGERSENPVFCLTSFMNGNLPSI